MTNLFKEFINDIFGMPDPDWFIRKWTYHIQDAFKAEEKLEIIKELVEAAPDPEILHIGDGKRRYGLFLIQLREAMGVFTKRPQEEP